MTNRSHIGDHINFSAMPENYWSWRLDEEDKLSLHSLGLCNGFDQADDLDAGHGLFLVSRSSMMEFLFAGKKILAAKTDVNFFAWVDTGDLFGVFGENIERAMENSPGNTLHLFARYSLETFLVLMRSELTNSTPGYAGIFIDVPATVVHVDIPEEFKITQASAFN